MIEQVELRRLFKEHVGELVLRYGAALTAAGYDGLVIHSGRPKKRSEWDDQYLALRPTPFFQHFAALDEPDCALVVRPDRVPLLAHVPSGDVWEKPAPPESEHLASALDVVHPARVEAVRDHLPATGRLAFLGDDTTRAAMWGLAEQNPPDLVRALDALRVHKTPYEVACLAEANRRAAVGHVAVRRRFLDGDAGELELHLAFLSATAQDDPQTPYKNIVALGDHAATLHHIHYDRRARPRPAESLLLDAGATFLGYCSDVTRTWVRGHGAAASAFAGLIAAVEDMQQRLCAQVRVGTPYEALHDASHREVSTILRDVGLVRLSPDEIDAAGISRAFYPHGLGHSLGLQCHDVGCAIVRPRADNPFLRNTSTISEQQVFTIEPGVYFIDALLAPLRDGPHGGAIDWSLVDALRPFGGIRIEDDLVVTAAAARNLTREQLPAGGGVVS